jgi:hypothetical protein
MQHSHHSNFALLKYEERNMTMPFLSAPDRYTSNPWLFGDWSAGIGDAGDVFDVLEQESNVSVSVVGVILAGIPGPDCPEVLSRLFGVRDA